MNRTERPGGHNERVPSRPWDRLVGCEPVVLAVFTAVNIFTTQTARFPSHIVWAQVAAGGCGAGLLVSVLFRRRGLGYVVAFLGSVVAAAIVLIARNLAQPEVPVLVAGAHSWVSTGSPYLAHPATTYDYRPYLPALFAFGIPEALAHTHWLDPRVIGGIVLLGALAASAALTSRVSTSAGARTSTEGPLPWRLVVALAAVGSFPPIAQSWTASFIDVPQTTLTILAFALVAAAATSRRGGVMLLASGAALGLTVAMKPIGLCALFVVVLWSWRSSGIGAATRIALGAAVAFLVAVVPVLLQDASSLWLNVVRFPSGQAPLKTPAGSPFPGALLWQATGRHSLEGTAVLGVAGLLFAAYCLLRPPTDVRTAVRLLAIGWWIAFLAAPTGRYGYLWMPLAVWWSVSAMTTPDLRAAEVSEERA
jgi:hypothetical protein